jgi:iron complex outermembrane receptor protein
VETTFRFSKRIFDASLSLTGSILVLSASTAGGAHAQSSGSLPPVVVEGAAPKKKAAKKAAPSQSAVQSVKTPSEELPPQQAAASSGPNQSSPGPNLSTAGTSGSRLGLTPLETPASVDIISGETARERGQFSTVEAVTQNAPGFSSVAMPVLGSAFAARGFQGNNSVMQLYDGTRLFPGRGSITFPFNMWSVERIEVLHGPASVLYGDGAIGGIINVIPKKPITEGMFNEAQVFFDSNMTRRASLDSGGAISKDLSYRFNVSADASDGWVDRGESENLGISGALRWQATSDIAFTLSHDYGDQEPMKYFGTPYRNGVFDKRTKDNNYNVANAMTEFRDSWTQFKTEWKVNDQLSLRNVAYMLDSRREFRNAEDYLWGYLSGPDLVDREGIHIRQKQEQIGNRFDATMRTSIAGIGNETVVGVDVNRAKFGYASYFVDGFSLIPIDPVDPYHPEPGLFPNPNLLIPGFASELDQKSLFAENRIVFNEYLSLVGGVRWDSSTLTRNDLSIPANGFEKEFNSFNWRVGAVVTPVRNLAFFGQYSVATDPLDVPLLDYAKDISNLKQTQGRQFEIGVKQSLWDGAFEWSLAAYDIVKTDLLVRDYSSFPASLSQIGQQSSQGLEATVGIVLGRGWRVDANGALLKAQYDDFSYIDFSTFGMVDHSGNVPLLVPEKTANIWLTWDFAVGWRASAGLQYVGEAFVDHANTIERPAYTTTNVGLQWKPTDKATLDFRIKNLFDEVYAPYVRSYPYDDNMVQGWVAPPRTFEAALSVKF